MASLLNLPVEIQLSICTELLHGVAKTTQPKPGVGTWQSTLQNHAALGGLSLTCKHLQTITAAPLYQRVRVSIRKPAAFIRLIRHFSRFPERAGLVRELIIHSGRAGPPLTKSQKNFLFREAHRLGLRLLIGGGSLSGQLESILIDVALCELPTLRRLVLDLPWTTTAEEEESPVPYDDTELEEERFRAFVFRYASRLPTHFVLCSLECLEVYPLHFKKSVTARLHTESVTALLRHTPALTHLITGRCDIQASRLGIIQTLLPQLRDIHLANALEQDLASIKRFCPRLRRFRLGNDDRSDTPMHGIWLRMCLVGPSLRPGPPKISVTPNVFKALLPMKNTLNDIDLDDDAYRAQRIGDLAQLSNFRALRSLRLVFGTWPAGDIAALLNNLSPHLEYLCLGGGGIPVHKIAVLLRERIRGGQLPRLKRFEYTLLNFTELVGQDVLDKAASVLRECGVDCEDRPYPRIMHMHYPGVDALWEE